MSYVQAPFLLEENFSSPGWLDITRAGSISIASERGPDAMLTLLGDRDSLSPLPIQI
jgi:hypothetical protein